MMISFVVTTLMTTTTVAFTVVSPLTISSLHHQHHHLHLPTAVTLKRRPSSAFSNIPSPPKSSHSLLILPMTQEDNSNTDETNHINSSITSISDNQNNNRKNLATGKNKNNIMTTTMAAATILLSSLSVLSLDSLPANAAMSGGRMGGSFSRSSSYGGSRGGSSMRLASPSRSSYYSGGGGSRGYGGGYYGGPRRTTIVAPIISPFASVNPFYNPIVPYYGGGVGAISYARGPGLFDLLFLGGLGFFVISALSNTIRDASSSFGSSQWDDDNTTRNPFTSLTTAPATTTVIKCNVALEVPNRDDPQQSILMILDRMAKVTAKTDTRKGVITLTQQVALELLRRKSYINSATGTIQTYKNDKDAQRTYNQWSIQERSKFEQENINKYNQFDLSLVKKKETSSLPTNDLASSSSKATMAVVTLVLSLEGSALSNNNLPKQIKSRSDLLELLQAIASIPTTTSTNNNDILYGAEILWTPEDRSETLTKQDILADYPELNIL